MKTFDQLWRDISARCQKYAMPLVQNREELEHVFKLMGNCGSYLEVGTAEGNSLYVLGRALKPRSKIAYIDYGEKHTEEPRNDVVAGLRDEDHDVQGILGDSTLHETASKLASLHGGFYPDAVMIDAGHTEPNVMADAIQYAPRARKYVFFHDITMPAVAKAFKWYSQHAEQTFKASKFVNSDNFGYGILTKRF